MRAKTNYCLLALFLVSFSPNQKEKSIELIQPESKLTVTGTSNVHDWEMSLTQFDGNAIVQFGDNNVIDKIKSLQVKFYAKSFTSGNSIMNSKTYAALKADSYPIISFNLSEIKSVTTNKNQENVLATGKLTIAGVSKETQIETTISINNKGEYEFNGKKEIDMPDFGIKPPEALFGTLKTGNKVTVTFHVVFAARK